MPNEIQLAEMQADLADTKSDIQALSAIVKALDVFMTRTGGEDRSGFRTDKFKYTTLLNQALRLRDKIQSLITDAQ